MKITSRRLWPPGIRFQLMLWYIMVFAILLFFSDAILYTQQQKSLLSNLDAMLQFQAGQITSGITINHGIITIQDITGDLPDISTATTHNLPITNGDIIFGTLIRVLDMKGKEVLTSAAFHGLIIPRESFTQPLHGIPWYGNLTMRDGHMIRLYSMELSDNNTPFAIVQIGESLRQLNTSLRTLAVELCLITPFILLLGALGSYFLATRAFVPIDRLTNTARQINAGDLHQRVPVPRAQDEVYHLAQTLNEMIERLEQAFTRQRRFVADASHELRTPVAVIRSMTDLALLQLLTPKEYALVLDNINAEAIRLSHLINDLLALARTDEGKAILKPEAVRLDQLITVVALHAEVMAMKHQITIQIHTPEPLVIMGDEGRLIQMIMNLLDNAIIYTNAGGQVTITLEKKDASACIIIHDTGIGIAPEHIPSIFERFYRVDPARVRTDTNNSGLGLAIVEWVIHAHGGSIAVESQIGQGSTFVVTLPLNFHKAGSTSHEKA